MTKETKETDQSLADILAQADPGPTTIGSVTISLAEKLNKGVQLSPADRGTLTHILNGVGDCLAKIDRLIAENAGKPETPADILATSTDGTAYANEVRHRQRHDMVFVFLLGVACGVGVAGVLYAMLGG